MRKKRALPKEAVRATGTGSAANQPVLDWR